MLVYVDPTTEQIEQLCAESEFQAAKWIRIPNGWTVYWRAEDARHTEIARMFHAETYEKGLVVPAPVSVH